MIEHFKNVDVLDGEGVSHRVPISVADEIPPKIVIENTVESGIPDRVQLPQLKIYSNGKTHTLYAFTLYAEQMNQIVEQVLMKFTPEFEEAGLNLLTIARNDILESVRILKAEFCMEEI